MDITSMEVENEKTSELNDLPWVEKYRPKQLSDLVAHEEIINILDRLIESNKLPHLLFHGPPGTGKTSTIVACARKMYGEQYSTMTLELNASDDRGIDTVRNQIKEFAGTKNSFGANTSKNAGGPKLIILDEADAMTSDAQAALRRVIEKYTSNARFCLICNYINKITPALQSRCTRFRFAPLHRDQISARLDEVIQNESVNCTSSGSNAILQLCNGDMRRVLNLLQSSCMAYPCVDEEAVYLTAGAALPSVIGDMLQSLLNDDFITAYNKINQSIVDHGYALCDIIADINTQVCKLDLPDTVMASLIDNLSNIEYRLSHGLNERLQVGAFVGSFTTIRCMMSS